MKQETLLIGQIVRPQGIHGQLKVMPLTDDPARFMKLKTVLLQTKQKTVTYQITKCDCRQGNVYLHLAGIEERTEAEKLRGAFLAVERNQAVELPQDTDFICDLVGCRVVTNQGNVLGTLHEVLQNGATDVYVIHGEKNVMVPALKKLFLEVDIDKKQMLVDEAILAEVAVWDEN